MNNTQDGIIKALETLVLHSNALKDHKENQTLIGKTLEFHQRHLEVHEQKLDLLCDSLTTLAQELLNLKNANAVTFGVN
jgi:hypothetical protein